MSTSMTGVLTPATRAIVLWLVTLAASAPLVARLSLVDLLVVLAVSVVLPLAIGGHPWWWQAAAVAVVASFLMPVGPAGALVVPFVVVATVVLFDRIGATGALSLRRLGDTVDVLAAGYAVVAAGALTLSRSGVALFGVYEPIVELTAVHYSFAGSAALVLGGATLRDACGAWRWPSVLAVVFTAAAPPIVALGFVTRAALPQVGGAVVMTLGVWLTAGLQLRTVIGRRVSRATVLLAISGLAVWAPMILALAWAAGQHWRVPMLSIPDMERTHGVANALAFVLCGLLARRRDAAVRADGRAMVVV